MSDTPAPPGTLTDDGRRTVAPFGRRRVTIERSEPLGPYHLLTVRDPEGPAPRPGQFYMLAAVERWGAGEGGRPFLPRAFSVLRARDGNWREFFLEDVGPGTNRLTELDAGEEMWITGPLGIGFAPPPDGRRALLVGGGIGIAPLLILQDELGPEARPLLGFRSAEHAVAAELFDGAQVATDDGGAGHHGLVTDLLEAELDADPHAIVYACGPPPMLEAVRATLAQRDLPGQLALESGMACGYGACFGCVVPTKTGYVRLCVDGPVLDAATLDTALEPHR